MSLKYKTFLFVALAVSALLIGTVAASRYLVLGQFEAIEQAALREKLADGSAIVAMMVKEFEQRGEDWSDWDDMVTFVADGNKEFVEANVSNAGLEACGWDVFVVLAEDGTRRSSVWRDREKDEFHPVPARINQLIDQGALKPAAKAVSGLEHIDGKVWLLASRRVYKSDKTEASTRGWMVTGRIMDPPWVERFRKFTFLDATFLPLADAAPDAEAEAARSALGSGRPDYVVDRPNDVLAGYVRVNDMMGKPILDMRVVRPHVLSVAASSTLSSLTRMIAIAGGLLALLSVLFMNRAVLHRIAKLASGVKRLRAGERASVEVAGRDELADLGHAFNDMARTIKDREDALKLTLDNVGDGLVTTTLAGDVVGQTSAPGIRWFGSPAAGAKVWDWLGASEELSSRFTMGYEQFAEGFLPFELLAEQMPSRMQAGDATYEFDYRPVLDAAGELSHVLVIVSDVTARLEQERAEAEARELHLVVANILKDRRGFIRFTKECSELVERVCTTDDDGDRKRALHTLKGAASVYGLLSVGHVCHAIEDELAADPECFNADRAARLRDVWAAAMHRVREYVESEDKVIELSLQDYERFLLEVQARRDHGRLARRVKAWRNEPTSKILGRLAAGARRLAVNQGKDVDIQVRDGGVRVDIERMAEFWSSLVHVVRNSVDHGIEAPSERESASKPARARLTLATEIRGDRLVLTVTDDGRGVDWERIRAKAASHGLTSDTREALIAAMFTSGISSKDQATDVSGRGVGLDAVLKAVKGIGGECAVESREGAGTTFEFAIPLPDSEFAQLAWSIVPAAS